MSHSILSPSQAERWCYCPGSVAMTIDLPEEESEYAAEGTRAHAILHNVLMNRDITKEMEPNDQKRAEAVSHAQELQSLLYKENAEKIYSEIEIDLSKIYGVSDSKGTADLIVLKNGDELHIWDYKYGANRVEAEGNLQLISYLLGAKLVFGQNRTQFYTHIYQPRLNHHSVAKIDGEMLSAYETWFAIRAKEAITADSTQLRPREKSCKFCKARNFCPALRNEVEGIVSAELTTEKKRSGTNLPGNVKDILDKIPLIEQYCKSIRDAAYKHLLGGGSIEGYKLVKGISGHRKWKDEAAVVSLFESLKIRKAQYIEKKIISPTQAEKLLKKGGKWEKFTDLIIRGEGAPVMVPTSDERPEIATNVIDEFQKIEGE